MFVINTLSIFSRLLIKVYNVLKCECPSIFLQFEFIIVGKFLILGTPHASRYCQNLSNKYAQ